MSDCICNSNLPSRLLRGVTRTVKITVVDKNDDPVDLTIAREVTVRVSMDGRPWSEAYVPGISISGEGNNIVTFTWYADVQRCGRYTIDLNADFGNRNQSRVDFHREFGVELVEHSNEVSVTPSETLDVDDELDLEGTLEVTTDGMSAFDQWRTSPESEGYPPTEEGFFDWMRQPATDAATAAATQMGQIQDRADEDHRLAAADHTTAGNDHTRAEGDHTQAGQDHTRAEQDHTIAGQDHTQAGQDHTQAGNDHTTAAADHTIAGQDHTQAGQDHTRAEQDHTRAEGDHTQAGQDHTRAEQDHTRAEGDHTQAGQDHTRAEQDHTRAEQDHASVGDAVKYTQQTLTDEQKAQARSNIGAGTYTKPANGIPASDMASGVIPTVPAISTDIASDATSDTKTTSPKAVKTFVEGKGYGTYSKPSGGIPKTDLAQAVNDMLTGWQVHDLGEIDASDYDDDYEAYIKGELQQDGNYRFSYDGFCYFVHVETVYNEDSGATSIRQQVWGDEEGARSLYQFALVVEDGEITHEETSYILDSESATAMFAPFSHYHYTNDNGAQSVWDYCDSGSFIWNNDGRIFYRDTLNSKSYIIERGTISNAPYGRFQKVQPLDDATHFYQRVASRSGSSWVWGSWVQYNATPAIATTQPAGGFLPNVVYDLGTLTGAVTFALASPTDNTRPNPYHWTFDTGSTAPTITWPANLTWAGGSAPTISESKHYEIMVRNGYATALEF